MGSRGMSWGVAGGIVALRLVHEVVASAERKGLAQRIGSVPQNTLMMQKLMLNRTLKHGSAVDTEDGHAVDGIARHTREGLNFKRCAAEAGWKQAVEERDQGSFDWTRSEPLAQSR